MPIRLLAFAFFGAQIVLAQPPPEPPPAPTPSVVYSVRNSEAIEQYRTNANVVRGMVDRLLLAVTAQTDVPSAWRSLIKPEDKVGIKISAGGSGLFTTHRDVVNAIVDGLASAGVARDSIIVWDRRLDGLKDAGYRIRGEGYQLREIEPREGYDEKAAFSAALMGKLIWGDLKYIPRKGENPLESDSDNTSNISHLAQIVSSQVTKIINVPVMSESATTGLAGCLHNMTLPNVDNWRRFTQFGNMGAAGIAELYAEPNIRGKVVLNIMDGLIATYAAGPEAHPNYAVHHATLLASKDPVAMDALALSRVEQWRRERDLPPIGRLAAHIEIAGQFGLGNGEPSRIQLKELGR